MSFDHLLNEYRRRAGLSPVKEQLDDPESNGYVDKQKDQTRQYVDRLSTMLKRIHELASQGLTHANTQEHFKIFQEILNTLGVKESVEVSEEDQDLNLTDITEFESEEEEVSSIKSRAGLK